VPGDPPHAVGIVPAELSAHLLADCDQTRGVLKARCGHQLPLVVAVGDHRPPGRVCFPYELIARANLDAPVAR
jgi:hypothetical protein